MRQVIGNFGVLIRGRGVAAAFSFGATTLMARALGPAEFGMVVLMQAYVLLINGLSNFRPFEAVVHFGVPAHDADDTRTLRRLIKVCRRVDRYSSLAGTAVALLLAPLIGPSMGMSPAHVILLTAYSLVLLTAGTGTSTGILRLYHQLNAMGRQMAIGPSIRFFGVAIGWWLDAPLTAFVAIWAFAYGAENIYLHRLGRREYHQRLGQHPDAESVDDARLAEFSGLRRFLWVSYWQSNMDLVPKHISTVLAGYLMGSTEAGLLRLARELASLLAKPAVLIRQVVFIDLTRSWHQGSDTFDLIAYRTAMLGGGLGLLFVAVGYFFGDTLLAKLIGREFIAAAPVLTLMLLAATFDLSASPLRSAAYAIGRAGQVLRMHVLAAVVYLALFVALTWWLGLIGAGVAACVAAVLPLIGMAALIRGSARP